MSDNPSPKKNKHKKKTGSSKTKTRSTGHHTKAIKVQTNEPIQPKKLTTPKKKAEGKTETTEIEKVTTHPLEQSEGIEGKFSSQINQLPAQTTPPSSPAATVQHPTSPAGTVQSTPQSNSTPEKHQPDLYRQSSKLSVDDVAQTEDGLKTLMKKGAWKSVLKLAEACIATATLPHHKLQYRLCRIIGMIKMRMFQSAYNEYILIGNFEDPQNHYQYYPDLYPGKKGSMIPFSMRALLAELPHFMGKDPTMDTLYSLLNLCKGQIEQFQEKEKEKQKATEYEKGIHELLKEQKEDTKNDSTVRQDTPTASGEKRPEPDLLTERIEPEKIETVKIETEKIDTVKIETDEKNRHGQD